MHLSISSSKFISLGTPRQPAAGKSLVIPQTAYLLEIPNSIFPHEQQQALFIANEERRHRSLRKIIPPVSAGLGENQFRPNNSVRKMFF